MQTNDSKPVENASKSTTHFEKVKAALPTFAVVVLVVVSVVYSPSIWLPRSWHLGGGLGPVLETHEEPIDLVKVAENANMEMVRQVAVAQSTATARAEFAEQAFTSLRDSVREEKEREAREKRWRLIGMGFVTIASVVLAVFTFRNPAAPDWAKEVLKVAAGAIFAGWFGK